MESQWVLEAVAGYNLELGKVPRQWHHPVTVAQKKRALIQKSFPVKRVLLNTIPSAKEREPTQTRGQSSTPQEDYESWTFQGGGDALCVAWWTPDDRAHFEGCLLRDSCPQAPPECLRFKWSYQFQSLPFGLSTALCTFTKVLRPVVGLLRELGIRCMIYLDDILFLNQDKALAHQQTRTAIGFLESLGSTITNQSWTQCRS